MKQTLRSTYDYSRLIASAKKESQYRNFSTFINDKIRQAREDYRDGEEKNFNRSTMAEMIGIDVSTLTKIINGSQGTRKRDIIIAICFTLRLSENDTNLALNLYPMAPLNQNNMRDLVITQAIRDGVSLRQLNDILADNGLLRLNILRGDSKSEDSSFYYPHNGTVYKEISVNVTPYCIAGDDSELSLNVRYRPDRYDYYSQMIIRQDNNDGQLFRISREADGQYEIEIYKEDNWKLLHTNDDLRQIYEHVSPCKDPSLILELTRLKEYTDRKARYVFNMCNDTRNYGSRFHVVNEQGKLLIYGESFGFDAPELSEYFQMEASSGGCMFTVSNTSRFLERYLRTDEWIKLYGSLPSPAARSFRSFDEIHNLRLRKYFQALIDGACELLDQLRKRELFIINARAFIEIDELMHIYHVEKAFECYPPEDEPYEIVPRNKQITGPDGNPVTVNDLYRAAELDISTLEELCDIRTRYGSLEQFLQIDTLTEQKGKTHE